MGWAFWRKPSPPPLHDKREWNDDWEIGDTAECVVEPSSARWSSVVPPWARPKLGARFIVIGFDQGVGAGGDAIYYFLQLEGFPYGISTQAFRKVKPTASERSEIVERILTAKPGRDRVRHKAKAS